MAKITQLSQLDLNQTYSYADYLTWQFDEAIELIKGKVMLMSPAPNVKHQDISLNLTRSLAVFLTIKNVEFMLHLLIYVYMIVKNQS